VGCGGFIKGCDGEWLRGFAKSISTCCVYIGKLWSMLEELKYARRLRFTIVNDLSIKI